MVHISVNSTHMADMMTRFVYGSMGRKEEKRERERGEPEWVHNETTIIHQIVPGSKIKRSNLQLVGYMWSVPAVYWHYVDVLLLT